MTVLLRGLLPAALVTAALAAGPATGADLRRDGVPGLLRAGRFLASCEDLGQFCFADACGRNQIEAALACRSVCPSSVILGVVPGSCPLPPRDGRVRVRLRSRG